VKKTWLTETFAVGIWVKVLSSVNGFLAPVLGGDSGGVEGRAEM